MRALAGLIVVLLGGGVGMARADEPAGPPPQVATDRPWAKGVPEAEQATALELLQKGNAQFAELRYTQALAIYREALTHWDHPSLHFNVAVCLINLEQPLEASEHLAKSMAYGAPAIGDEYYSQGLTLRKLLDAQLAHAQITCHEPGAQVSLDGKTLYTGPGSAELVLMPGPHQIVATKPGFNTQTETITLVAGHLQTHDIRLVAFKATTRVVRRWTWWEPWAVVAGGAAIAGAGGIAHVVAADHLATYDNGIAKNCPHGCGPDQSFPDLDRARAHANRDQDLAIALWAIGGAVAAVGIVGAIANQPRELVEAPPRSMPLVIPGPSGATLAWSFRF